MPRYRITVKGEEPWEVSLHWLHRLTDPQGVELYQVQPTNREGSLTFRIDETELQRID